MQTALSLATMLLRKCDWHDEPGVALLLGHGADPNADTYWHKTALSQAVLRDNSLSIVTRLVDHGADPNKSYGTPTAGSLAARRGALICSRSSPRAALSSNCRRSSVC